MNLGFTRAQMTGTSGSIQTVPFTRAAVLPAVQERIAAQKAAEQEAAAVAAIARANETKKLEAENAELDLRLNTIKQQAAALDSEEQALATLKATGGIDPKILAMIAVPIILVLFMRALK